MDIPGFVVQEKLGESSLTEVWKARQVALARDVTLKLLKPECAADPDEVRLFFDEARSTCRLSHHGIVRIYSVGEHGGLCYVVMEHVAGPTLEQVIAARTRVAPRAAASIALQTAEALAYAWREWRLIHRNVTPRSIMMDADGTAKLAYFGLSLRVDPAQPSRRLEPGMIVGTPNYMSPEQARGEAGLDFRTDMYGLGATLYHAVTGSLPFGDVAPREALHRQIHATLPHPERLCQAIPSCLTYVMQRLMMKDPADRFADWDEAVEILRKAASGTPVMLSGKTREGSTVAATPERRIRVRRRAPRS